MSIAGDPLFGFLAMMIELKKIETKKKQVAKRVFLW
jgi:hypothetical protein